MNEEMMKSLASLIDESLAELEVMKKSDRFSASEIKLGGPGAGIAGKDPQGSLGKDEEEDDEDEDDEEGEEGEEGEEDKKEDKKPVIGKADGVNDKAEKADDMKKSLEEQSTLLKSYVDNKFAAFESQLDKITKLVSDIADAPVAAKSVSYRGIAPLKKSIAGESEGEPLTKSVLVEKLFSLKKSGTRVDSADIAGAELANGNELVKIANKYNIK
jgi:hypothetical protein